MKNLSTVIFLIASACSNIKPETIKIGENTFVHEDRVFRIIDNEITELGSLSSDTLSKSAVLDPKLRTFGTHSFGYVKEGASTQLLAVYRGDVLYYRLDLHGLNDLRDNYSGGGLAINLLDEFGFQIHSINIDKSELIRILDENHETSHFEYNGKEKMSNEISQAISDYSVSSYLRKGW